MNVHINRPSSTRFIAQVRLEGHRIWRPVGPYRVNIEYAIKEMARAFASGRYKRGRVIMIADYYDPNVVVEMQRV